MKQARGKTIAIVCTALGIAVIAAFLFVTKGEPIRRAISAVFRPSPSVDDLFRNPSATTAVITKGPIPVSEFLEFLQDFSGITVMCDSQSIAGRVIKIPADIKDVDGRLVLEILRENGYTLSREDLPGGRTIIRVKAPPGK
jgi:hypothetical protein